MTDGDLRKPIFRDYRAILTLANGDILQVATNMVAWVSQLEDGRALMRYFHFLEREEFGVGEPARFRVNALFAPGIDKWREAENQSGDPLGWIITTAEVVDIEEAYRSDTPTV